MFDTELEQLIVLFGQCGHTAGVDQILLPGKDSGPRDVRDRVPGPARRIDHVRRGRFLTKRDQAEPAARAWPAPPGQCLPQPAVRGREPQVPHRVDRTAVTPVTGPAQPAPRPPGQWAIRACPTGEPSTFAAESVDPPGHEGLVADTAGDQTSGREERPADELVGAELAAGQHAEAFDSGVLFETGVAERLIDHTRQCYAGARGVETEQALRDLPTTRT